MTFSEQSVVARPEGTTFAGFGYPGSVVVLPTGRLLATFTGVRLRGPYEAVGAYSGDGGRTWSAVVTLFGGDRLGSTTVDTGESYADPNLVVIDDRRVMAFCISLRYDATVWDLSRTRFWRRISDDGGETFGPVEEMPRHRKYIVGTVHPGLRLPNGTLVMGYSWDRPAEVGRPASGEGGMDLVSGVLISRDEGMTWLPGGDCCADTARSPDALPHATNGIDEPAIVALAKDDLFLLGRTGTHNLWQSFSHDGGMSWCPPIPSPLCSHNCPAALLRLANGNVMVVYNDDPLHRVNLCVRVSDDGCRTWSSAHRVAAIGDTSEEVQAAYPNACQLADGTVVVVFYRVARGNSAAPHSIVAVRFPPEMLENTSCRSDGSAIE